MIETIEFKGNIYPSFQSKGNAAQFAIPFAKHVCKGLGVDVGCNRHEWSFPGAIPSDPEINHFSATEFHSDFENLDYVFSSHCIEHLPNWVEALDYWHTRLKSGGVVFLYLPDHCLFSRLL